MTLQTTLLILVILVWIVLHYGLIIWALRDLYLRPRVRGDNKITWALVILVLPVIGPLIYSVYGPASFLPRVRPGERRTPFGPGR